VPAVAADCILGRLVDVGSSWHGGCCLLNKI
jgi:hypothetical protein